VKDLRDNFSTLYVAKVEILLTFECFQSQEKEERTEGEERETVKRVSAN